MLKKSYESSIAFTKMSTAFPRTGQPARYWTIEIKYAPPILKELKEELINIKNKKSTLPKSELSKAINYTLNEYDALCNYIRSADYAPDNNAIERLMRYISLSRRNSLFCGSHQGG